MADIDVERKGPSIWPWVIGLIVLALLIWALVELFGGDDDVRVDDPVGAPVVTPEPAGPADQAVPGAVTTYLRQCTDQQGAPRQDMGRQHEHTVGCLQRLREGIDALVTQEQVADTDVSARLEEYTGTVQQLEQSEPTATEHANLTRSAAGTAAEVLQAMRTAWFEGDQQVQSAVDEAERAAEEIRGNVQMLEQRESVVAFFREAGDALRTMAEKRRARPAVR